MFAKKIIAVSIFGVLSVTGSQNVLAAHDAAYVKDMGGSCPKGGVYVADKRSFYKCECTSYVAYKVSKAIPEFYNYFAGQHWGNAKNWTTAASKLNVTVSTTPKIGDMAVWETGTYGHVAYVESVNSDGTANISEYNLKNDHQFTTRNNVRATKYVRVSSPQMLTPTSGQTVSRTNAMFKWEPALAALGKGGGYRLVISQGPNRLGFVENSGNSYCGATCNTQRTSATTFSTPLSRANAPYYASVRVGTATWGGNWSPEVGFRSSK